MWQKEMFSIGFTLLFKLRIWNLRENIMMSYKPLRVLIFYHEIYNYEKYIYLKI